MGRRKPLAVWGVDPGNAQAGVALWFGGRLVWHATIKTWEIYHEPQPPLHELPEDVRHVVYVKVPGHGARKSRAGVNFAAGFLVSWLCLQAELEDQKILRRNVKKVTPNEWRAGVQIVPDEREDLKSTAVERVEQMGVEVKSHDEAEAILIGKYGSMEEGVEA